MKQLWHMIERYYPWLLLLLGVDCFCAVILWISDIQVFQPLIGLVVLTSILLFSAILFVLNLLKSQAPIERKFAGGKRA